MDVIVVPENVLANHVVENEMIIYCHPRSEVGPMINVTAVPLQIQPGAFGVLPIKRLTMSHCDMNATMDYSFLSGFYRLKKLEINKSPNMDLEDEWKKLFQMPISNLNNCSTQRRFAELGLNELTLNECGMTESTISLILQGLLNHSSDDTLLKLDLSGNKLRAIPKEIKSFTWLSHLTIDNNRPGYVISVMTNESLFLPSQPFFIFYKIWMRIHLNEIGLQHIEPGAFRGNSSHD